MNLFQMTIIYNTVGKSPIEEMSSPYNPKKKKKKESKRQYLGATSKMTE